MEEHVIWSNGALSVGCPVFEDRMTDEANEV